MTDRGGPSLLDDLLHDDPLAGTAGWGLLTGIRLGFGPLWPVVLLLLLGGLVAVVRGPRELRPAAAAGALGGLAFTLLPNTGGSSFQFNLRYLTPALVLGAVATAGWVGAHPLRRWPVTTLLAAIVGANLFAAHHERVEAWPLRPTLTVLLAIAGAGAAVLLHRHGATSFGRIGVAGIAALAAGGGWIVQEHHLTHRYRHVGLHDDVLNAAFRDVSGAEVHVLGSPEAYPFFGADLTNVVVDHTDALLLGVTAPDDPCRYWRTQLRRADRIVISEFGFVQRRFSTEERAAVFTADPAVTTLFDDGARAIYRVEGALDPTTCPASGAG